MPPMSTMPTMLLRDAMTELLLAKDYTPLAAQRRKETLLAFLHWADAQEVTHVEQVTRGVIRRYIAHLRDQPNLRYGGHLASETQHSRASIVRMFLRFCVREEWLDERVVAYFEMPKKARKLVPVFTPDHYARLLHATDACPLPALRLRDKALLAVMFETGARAMEVCSLRMEAVCIAPHESYIRVEGKGRAQREMGLGKQASLALHRYLTRGRPAVADSPLVFLSRDGKPMTPNAIDRVLYRLRRVAGVAHFVGVRCSAHTLRHSMAYHYMSQGCGDVFKLSRLLGHENVQTTQRYLAAYVARDARLSSRSVLDGL